MGKVCGRYSVFFLLPARFTQWNLHGISKFDDEAKSENRPENRALPLFSRGYRKHILLIPLLNT